MSKLEDFVALADYFDRKGFFDAADIIDGLIKKQAEKTQNEGRKEATTLRLKRLAVEKSDCNLLSLLKYVGKIVSRSVYDKQDREDVIQDAIAEFYTTFDPAKSRRWQTQAGFAAQHAVRAYYRHRTGISYAPEELRGTVPYQERLPDEPHGARTKAPPMPYTPARQETTLDTWGLVDAMSLLTEKEYDVLERHLKGWSWKEIAQDLGVSPQAILETKNRAMRKLQNLKMCEKQAEKTQNEGRKEARAPRLKRLAVGKINYDLPYLFERPEKRAEREKETLTFREEEPAYEMKEEEDIEGSEYDLLDLFEGDQDVIDVMASLNKDAAEYQGKKVKLNDPIRNPSGSKKKFRVYVKDPKTKKIKKVQFGDPKLEIKRDDPERRKSFRARHKCDTEAAKDKTKAKYWSCYQWRKGKKVDE